MTTTLISETQLNETVKNVTLARVIHSEWIKFRSLRSSIWLTSASLVGLIVIALIVAYNTRHLGANIQANDADPSGPLQGYYLAMYLMGALGVIFVSGEYGTGMIRSTLTAVPKRIPVLWAKLLIMGSACLLMMSIACVVAFTGAQALISHYRHGYSLSSTANLRIVFGTALFLTLLALLGSALGWIIRSTAGALVTYFALVVALPLILTLFGHIGRTLAEYSPIFAGGSFITSIPESPSLHPWTGFIVLIVWVIVAIAIALWRLSRSDA